MTRTFDVDAKMRDARKDRLEVKLDGKVYLADVPTIDDHIENAKLLPERVRDEDDDRPITREEVLEQMDSIKRQLARCLKGKSNSKPPPDEVLGKLPPDVAGQLLREINRDPEAEEGNSNASAGTSTEQPSSPA